MWTMVVIALMNGIAITTIPNFSSKEKCVEQSKVLHDGNQSRPAILTYCISNQ